MAVARMDLFKGTAKTAMSSQQTMNAKPTAKTILSLIIVSPVFPLISLTARPG